MMLWPHQIKMLHEWYCVVPAFTIISVSFLTLSMLANEDEPTWTEWFFMPLAGLFLGTFSIIYWTTVAFFYWLIYGLSPWLDIILLDSLYIFSFIAFCTVNVYWLIVWPIRLIKNNKPPES
jgi:hypothetical protein